ncbi:P-loop NTPase fold protein [Klebsiella variicola]|uniref:P-loop NTPase fold protein n=1 Tax=Klebsiella variicola TaxID=244366 RepID=UPI00358EB0A0
MSTNEHIVENLNYYLSIPNPEYSFLITGDWGSGKTYFIETYITEYNEKSKGKIIKISLFGLSKTSHIDEKIFQELHPFLSHKYTKFAGNVLKGALKLGLKLDLNGDNKSDSTVGVNFDKINFNELFSTSEENNEIIIALDDLERTDIPLKEVLGYINYLVEISKAKVIIIANESKLLSKNEENNEHKKIERVYEEFKEKVIGKTFEVKHDFDDVLSIFLKESRYKELINFKHIIKHVYSLSSFHNFRNIKQAILDFDYLISVIDKKYINDNKFISVLIHNFFALTIEIKNGEINEKALRAGEPLKRKDFVTGTESKVALKYSLHETPLYSGKLWADILFKGSLVNLNEETSKLVYFNETLEKQPPRWLKLWYFTKMDDENEFTSLTSSLLNDFKTLKEEHPAIYLHNLALIIHFSKNKLLEISLDEIKELVSEYIKKHDKSSIWNKPHTYPLSYFNDTGYAYYNDIDEDFIKQRQIIENKINTEKQKEDINKKNNEHELFLLAIQDGNIQTIDDFFIKKNQYKPVFTSIDPNEFAKSLLHTSNSTINHIDMILAERYFSNSSLNGRPLHEYFRNEHAFWNNVYMLLDKDLQCQRGIKHYNLQRLNTSLIAKITEQLG